MAQPNGTRTVQCRYCGRKYKLNNFNRRHKGPLGPDGTRLTDTHLIACAKKLATKKQADADKS